MSLRLLRVGIRVHPEKGAFRIHGLGADPSGVEAPPKPDEASLISVGYDQMWIGSLQDNVEVTVLLEEWDGEPPAGNGAWENDVRDELYLRGAVAVSTTDSLPVLHGVQLRGGVSRYHVRVRARHRAEIARLYDQLLDRVRNTFDEEFQTALRELQGVEHYLVQLWPAARSTTTTGPTWTIDLPAAGPAPGGESGAPVTPDASRAPGGTGP